MHRSGTSALSHLLHLLGCDIPNTLMPASPSNPHGHWESVAIMELNEAILASGGSHWNDWLEFNPPWYESPAYRDFLDKGRAAIQQEFGASSLFIMKDPRCTKLVPFWRSVLNAEDIEPLVLIPTRNPIEVASSLQSRDEMHPSFTHLAWLRHVLDAEHKTRDLKRAFSTYDELLKDAPLLANKLQLSLGITWPRYCATSDHEIGDAIHLESRHHTEPATKILADPHLSRWLRETYRIMLKWADVGEAIADRPLLDEIREEFNAAGPAFAAITNFVSHEMAYSRQLEDRLRGAEANLSIATGELAKLKNGGETGTNPLSSGSANVNGHDNDLHDALGTPQDRAGAADDGAHLKQRTSMQGQLDTARASLGKMVDFTDHQEQQIAADDQTQQEVLAQLNDAQSALAKQAQENAALITEMASLRAQLAVAESTILQRHEEIEQTRAELFSERARAQRHDADHNQIKSKLAEADRWVFRLASDRQAALADIERLKSIIRDREAKLATANVLANNNATWRRQFRILQQRLAEHEAAANESEQSRTEMEAKLSESLDEIKKLTDLLQNKEGQPNSAGRMKERINEIAQLTHLLRLRESEMMAKSTQTEWLRKVTPILMQWRWWWAFMPSSWRVERQYRQLKKRGLFNKDTYLERYPDVAMADIDPLRHYVMHGILEDRVI